MALFAGLYFLNFGISATPASRHNERYAGFINDLLHLPGIGHRRAGCASLSLRLRGWVRPWRCSATRSTLRRVVQSFSGDGMRRQRFQQQEGDFSATIS
jgi:hypothetical protein